MLVLLLVNKRMNNELSKVYFWDFHVFTVAHTGHIRLSPVPPQPSRNKTIRHKMWQETHTWTNLLLGKYLRWHVVPAAWLLCAPGQPVLSSEPTPALGWLPWLLDDTADALGLAAWKPQSYLQGNQKHSSKWWSINNIVLWHVYNISNNDTEATYWRIQVNILKIAVYYFITLEFPTFSTVLSNNFLILLQKHAFVSCLKIVWWLQSQEWGERQHHCTAYKRMSCIPLQAPSGFELVLQNPTEDISHMSSLWPEPNWQRITEVMTLI